MSTAPAKPSLLNTTASEYGDGYREHLLEQYKLYVESAGQISERRTSANNYLLTVNTTLVTLFALTASLTDAHLWHLALAVGGVLVCLTWFNLIRSYRNLNTAKFAVIHELEQHLPAALFAYEWHVAEHGRTKTYRPLTHIEPFIPAVFAMIFVIVGIYSATASTTDRIAPTTTQQQEQSETFAE